MPAVAVIVRARRRNRTLAVLSLDPPPVARTAAAAVAAAAAIALLVVAAAQPALADSRPLDVRTDAQLYVVVDTSRSMTASATPHSGSRFARAVQFAIAFRDSLPQIPSGVASFTDRVLPHLLPSSDRPTFAATLRQAVGVDRPPPMVDKAPVATAYSLLAELPQGGAFSPRARRRLLVLLTDGESRPYSAAEVTDQLAHYGTRLLVVRFWSPDERVFVHGRDAGYRPDPASTPLLQRLGSLSVGRRIFGPHDVGAAAAAASRFFGSGATVRVATDRRATPLAPWIALAALVPLAGVALRRGGGVPARSRALPFARPAPASLFLPWRALRPLRSAVPVTLLKDAPQQQGGV